MSHSAQTALRARVGSCICAQKKRNLPSDQFEKGSGLLWEMNQGFKVLRILLIFCFWPAGTGPLVMRSSFASLPLWQRTKLQLLRTSFLNLTWTPWQTKHAESCSASPKEKFVVFINLTWTRWQIKQDGGICPPPPPPDATTPGLQSP